MRIAVLMTCFNRREQTLRCLANVRAQIAPEAEHERFELTTILVDDGSKDGTADAVRQEFPQVQLISGSGNLFWNRGMRVAFDNALRQGYDAYLWLNDDTMLYPHAIAQLVHASRGLQAAGITAIVTGSTCDQTDGRRSYGGFRWRQGWRRELVPVEPPVQSPVACDTMNGNCTLIPHDVAAVVGNLDEAFQHSFGDMDYGFRARAAGFAVYLAPGFVGTCSDNPPVGTWRDRRSSFARRWRHLNSPKGSPFREWSLYCQRHLGALWPLYTVSPYVKTLATAVRRPE